MLKYSPLTNDLAARGTDSIRYEFHQLDDLLGGLPPSARNHRAWWSNEGGARSHVQSQAWAIAGYAVESVDLAREVVQFRRKSRPRVGTTFAFYVRPDSHHEPPRAVLHISPELVPKLVAAISSGESSGELPLLEVQVPVRYGDEWIHPRWDTRFAVVLHDSDDD